MIFTTKNNELAIFGKTTDDVRKKLIDFNDVIMQGGSFSKKSEVQKLIPQNKLTQIISKSDATDIVNNLNTIKDKTNETYKSFDEYFAILKKDGQQCVVDYVKENQTQVYITDDVIDASKRARAEQIAYNATIKQSTLAFKAASIAKRILATIGNMAAMWALSKAIGAVTDPLHLLSTKKLHI